MVLTELPDFLESISAAGPKDKDADGKWPLFKAIQQSRDDPKLLNVILQLIEKMNCKDNSCSNRNRA